MTASPPPRRPSLSTALTLLVGAGLATALFVGADRISNLEQSLARMEEVTAEVHGEVTRMRIEQSSEAKGPAALLEHLRKYAPMCVDARVTEPDYQNARKELDAVLRAFERIGEDGWKPIVTRLAEANPRKDHDEIWWLLHAALRIDPPAAKQILQDILLGYRMPSLRLRQDAARILTDADKPLAQELLRRVLLTESYQGRDLERGAKYGMKALDPAAVATTGFNNFVVQYARTEDPQMDDTLLMVMGRAEHDQITVKECVEVLGRRKCAKAVKAIEAVYENPPLAQQNPLFLNSCLDALFEIQGKEAARPFLEKAATTADHELVTKHAQYLLNKESGGTVAARPPAEPSTGQPAQPKNSIAPPGRK